MNKKSFGTVIIFIGILLLYLSGNQLNSNNTCWLKGIPQSKAADKGIGPFQNVTLAPINQEKVKAGLNIFTNKCALCHELDNVKIGPPLRNVTKDNTPEFVLNMIVNPLEMQKSDTAVKNLMKKYNNVPMPDQKLSQDDVRTVYEYLRSVVK